MSDAKAEEEVLPEGEEEKKEVVDGDGGDGGEEEAGDGGGGGEGEEGKEGGVDAPASLEIEESEMLTEAGEAKLSYKDVRLDVVAAINKDREAAGLNPVEFDEELSFVADLHCQEMGSAGYTGHVSLDGRAPYARYFQGGCKAHVVENVYGVDARESERLTVAESTAASMLFDAHSSFMMAEPPHDQHRRHVLNAAHTHVGLGIYLDEQRFRMVEVFADKYVEVLAAAPDGEPAPSLALTTDETYLYAKCTSPSHAILACVVYYERHPEPLNPADADGVVAYDDFTSERVAVVWPWEMERLADGVMHIPIFLNALQPGLFYTQILVRGDVESIPYDGPSEDLDISAPDVIAATGVIMSCAGDGEVNTWAPGTAGAMDADLDLVVAGIEPFSEVVVSKGAEPTLLGFKRQNILLSPPAGPPAAAGEAPEPGASDPIVVSVANAPGLPPVSAVAIVTGDGDVSSIRPPEGFDLIEPNLADIFADSDAVRANLGGLVPDGDIKVSPPLVFLAVKRETDDVDDEALTKVVGEVGPSHSGEIGVTAPDPLLLDVAISMRLPGGPSLPIPEGYGHSETPVTVAAGEASVSGTVILAWSAAPDAVAEVLAAKEASKTAGDDPAAHFVGPAGGAGGSSASWEQDEKAQADMTELVGGDADEEEDDGQISVEDAEAVAQRKMAEREKLQLLLRDAQQERGELQDQNRALQKKLAAYFLLRQTEEEKTAEKAGTAGAGAGAGAGGGSAGLDAETRYLEVLQQVVVEKQRLGTMLNRCEAQAMELQSRLDDKEARANEIHKSFVEFKREIALASENSRTGKPIPKRIVKQFETTELAKDQEVERVRLKNIHLKAQLRKMEAKLKEKEQLADGLHLIDFEQLKIENQTLNEKIEDRNEDLHKFRKKTTQTVQVLTHVKEKLQFVQADAATLKLELASIEAQVSAQRDALSRAKHTRDKIRGENDKLRAQQGFVTNDKLVRDFEKRKKHIKTLEERVAELKDRYMFLTQETSAAKSRRAPAAV